MNKLATVINTIMQRTAAEYLPIQISYDRKTWLYFQLVACQEDFIAVRHGDGDVEYLNLSHILSIRL